MTAGFLRQRLWDSNFSLAKFCSHLSTSILKQRCAHLHKTISCRVQIHRFHCQEMMFIFERLWWENRNCLWKRRFFISIGRTVAVFFIIIVSVFKFFFHFCFAVCCYSKARNPTQTMHSPLHRWLSGSLQERINTQAGYRFRCLVTVSGENHPRL